MGKRRLESSDAGQACVGEIQKFICEGVPGVRRLAAAGLRERYHADDPEGWANSCNVAFAPYGRRIQRRLEEVGWDLALLDPCELWFPNLY